MIHFVVALALLLHVLFWGAGGAALAMPRPWRRCWPVLVAPAGFALQALVVWLGTYANLHGTNAYATWSEVLPLALIGVAARRRGLAVLARDARRFGGIFALSALALAAMVWPLASASKGLTTISLGSCDAADYAGGARALMEFARSDRTGFLGFTEVVRVMSANNFADFWLRLNHFAPAAIIALNGSVFRCAPHEITSLVTMLLLATMLPVAFWSARAISRQRPGASVAIAVLFAASPLAWYAVAHVAMGQLLAAPAIALLTWAGVALWRTKLGWHFSGVLAIGYALVLASYNFILVVALVPAVAFAGGHALWRGEWTRLGPWLVRMLAPLVVVGVIFFERVAGLVERFQLLQSFDFGWHIPVLTPEGWLGFVRGTDLSAWPLTVRAGASGAVVALLVWALVRRGKNAWLAASLTLPVLAGYAYLEWRGAEFGTNASYDAYKLFFVFLPVMLPAFCLWTRLRTGAVLMTLVLIASGSATARFVRELRHPPLLVDGEMRQLRKIEAMPDVKSVNVLLPDMWSRLWANYFLLRKPQYFATDTYEARWHTPLRGEWDLGGGIIGVRPPGEGRRQLTPHFAIVDTRGPQFLRADFGDGWHPEEQTPRTGDRWRWTKGDATLRLENPHAQALSAALTLDGWSFGERDLAVVDPRGATTAVQHLGQRRMKTHFAAVTVPPGASTLTIHSAQATAVPAGDTRAIGVCVFGIELEVAAK